MFVQDKRAMRKCGRCEAERPVEQNLPRGGEEQIRAAHDFADLHRGIVHDDGELIGGNPIVPPHDEIAEIFSRYKLLWAEMAVNEGDGFAVGNAKTEGGRFVIFDLRFLMGTARAGIDEFIIDGVGGGGGGLQVFAGAVARVNETALQKFLEGGAVKSHSLALVVRRKWAAEIGSFLPIEAEPTQVFEHGGDEFRLATRDVEVFVAQHQNSIAFPGALLGRPESPRMPEVQKARRRWRDAAAINLLRWACVRSVHPGFRRANRSGRAGES